MTFSLVWFSKSATRVESAAEAVATNNEAAARRVRRKVLLFTIYILVILSGTESAKLQPCQALWLLGQKVSMTPRLHKRIRRIQGPGELFPFSRWRTQLRARGRFRDICDSQM